MIHVDRADDHALAQHGLGWMLLEGDGVERDPAAAAGWFRLAADRGLAGSQAALGRMYEQGDGVERDPELARQWYRRAGLA